MSAVEYKCPCCGSPLTYDGESGKLLCESCQNKFDADVINDMDNGRDENEIEFAYKAESFDESDKQAIKGYICQSCGAELMTDENTTATACAYCGNPVVLPDAIESGVKPEIALPFKISKEKALQIFNDYFKGKRLLPNIFTDTHNRVSEIRKLFVPYWLFDCDAYADFIYDAEKVSTRREGDYEIKRTSHFMVRRSGWLGFDSIPVDASEKLDDSIGESLEPYDLSTSVAFNPAVLAGAMADRADVDAEVCRARAVERIESSVESTMRGTVHGYSSVRTRRRYIRSEDGKITPALMPVWLITTEKQESDGKKVYTFAINGQTGALTCDVPYAKGKARAWFFGVFAGVCAVGYATLVALNAWGVI